MYDEMKCNFASNPILFNQSFVPFNDLGSEARDLHITGIWLQLTWRRKLEKECD